MATNKNARLRYEALDKCFSNFSRKFFINDLQEAVCKYLTNELSIDTTISRRQIYNDIKEMQTSPTMQAPIVAYWDGQRKYYRYSIEGFSIVDLTNEELIELESTVNMLASFRGMPQFDWMHDIINKLKKKYKVTGPTRSVLSFDSNIDLVGINRFRELFGYIINEQPIKVRYTPFHSDPFDAIIHPYYLKQYNNRWYILGYFPERNDVSIYSLDRIESVEPIATPFIPDNIIINPEDYFYDVIGMTIPKNESPVKIKLRFTEHRYPYIKAKPIHPSQVNNDQERIISLNIIPNRELNATILGFGKDVEVLEPASLRNDIKSILEECCINYGLLKNDCKSSI